MASSGSLISRSNFSTSWSQTWSDSHSSKDQVRYVYMCCPVWYVVASATYAILGGSGIFQMYFSYWTGSAWSYEHHVECGATGGSITLRYGHNRNEGNLSGQPDWFNSNYPLWRIRYWPSRSNSRWSMTVYAGGWGLQNAGSYPIGQLIRSRGRSGASALIHSSGTTDDSSNAVNSIFNWTRRSGSPILGSDDSELVAYPY
jgi:hypothetical protein